MKVKGACEIVVIVLYCGRGKILALEGEGGGGYWFQINTLAPEIPFYAKLRLRLKRSFSRS
jgi:hypothetical protein